MMIFNSRGSFRTLLLLFAFANFFDLVYPSLVEEVKCALGQILCPDGKCVSEGLECDGCPAADVTCRDGSCVPGNKKCGDGVEDCPYPDNTDESSTPSHFLLKGNREPSEDLFYTVVTEETSRANSSRVHPCCLEYREPSEDLFYTVVTEETSRANSSRVHPCCLDRGNPLLRRIFC